MKIALVKNGQKTMVTIKERCGDAVWLEADDDSNTRELYPIEEVRRMFISHAELMKKID